MSIGERIKILRKFHKTSQAKFSDSIEIKQATLSQIENNVIAPSLDIIKKIIGNHNTTYDWLIDGQGEMLKPEKQDGDNFQVSHTKQKGSSNVVGNVVSVGQQGETVELLKAEIDKLKIENEGLKNQIQNLNELCKSKDEIIILLKDKTITKP